MIDSSSIDALDKAKVVDSDGDKVGTVGQVYVDETDGHPLFATVHTGLFGTKESFVPLESASFTDGTLRVGYTKAKIKDAPNIADDGAIDDAEQDRIFTYYDGASNSRGADAGRDSTSTDGGSSSAEGGFAGAATTAAAMPGNDRGTASGTDAASLSGADRETPITGAAPRSDARDGGASGRSADDAMTRSEERLKVGTRQTEAGRVKLRKHVVTEQQTVTVPVSHEEAHVEREPITDANRDKALAGPDIHEAEYAVDLNADEPVVDKETVPVERVRLNTETVTEQQQVTDDVRKERIDLDGADGGTQR